MSATTLSAKGQLVLPKPVREFLNVHAGDKLDFVIRDNAEGIVRPVVSDVRELRGMLHRRGRRPVTFDKTLRNSGLFHLL